MAVYELHAANENESWKTFMPLHDLYDHTGADALAAIELWSHFELVIYKFYLYLTEIMNMKWIACVNLGKEQERMRYPKYHFNSNYYKLYIVVVSSFLLGRAHSAYSRWYPFFYVISIPELMLFL